MRYRNTRTGEIIDIPSALHGGAWEPVNTAPVAAQKEEEVKPVIRKTAVRKKK